MPKVANTPSTPAAPEVAATRDDILDAAERMFAEHGYAGATLPASRMRPGSISPP